MFGGFVCLVFFMIKGRTVMEASLEILISEYGFFLTNIVSDWFNSYIRVSFPLLFLFDFRILGFHF